MGAPLAIIQATFTVEWPSTGPGHHCIYNDVARFLFFMTLFIYGYLICSDDRFWQAIYRHFRISLLLGTGCMAIMLSVWTRLGDLPTSSYTPGYMLYMALDGFNTWFWLLVFLGFGKKLLNFSNKVLEYAREASYPFYLLHETIMVLIGSYVVRMRAPVIVEFLVISMTTFLATIVLYHLIIRRANITRFLFGMKLRK